MVKYFGLVGAIGDALMFAIFYHRKVPVRQFVVGLWTQQGSYGEPGEH